MQHGGRRSCPRHQKTFQPSNCRSADISSTGLGCLWRLRCSRSPYPHRSSFIREASGVFTIYTSCPPTQARRRPCCSPPQLSVWSLHDLYERPVQGCMVPLPPSCLPRPYAPSRAPLPATPADAAALSAAHEAARQGRHLR
jgi:hypothetical protein